MSGWTNRGAYRTLGVRFRGQSNPSAFYLALVTATPAPDDADNTLGDLTEIAAGNGYAAGGQALSPGATDFDVWTEDDANHRALVQIRDVLWTASGGAIPGSGNDGLYAVLTDANATLGAREVFHFWDLGSDLSALTGQSLTVRDARDPDRHGGSVSAPALPRWARRSADDMIEVDPDLAYPVYLALLGIDLDDVDRFWLEVARRCLTSDLKALLGPPLAIRILEGSGRYAPASLPPGGGAALGAATFRTFYARIEGRGLSA